MSQWSEDLIVYRDIWADSLRLIIDGRDVTRFRRVTSQRGSYQRQEPHVYGPADFRFPQVTEHEIRSDHTLMPKELRWLRHFAPAKLIPVKDGVRGVPVWRGFVDQIGVSDGHVTVHCAGDASGTLALDQRQMPLLNRRSDLGVQVFDSYRTHNLILKPRLGAVTGVVMDYRGGGESCLDYTNALLADTVQANGDLWTVGRTADDRHYEMRLKDTTTIHATIIAGAPGVDLDLIHDLPDNTLYGSGIAPNGQKWFNGVHPRALQGPPPPFQMAGDAPFGEGTTNADTVSGEGITIMHWRLVGKYLDRADAGTEFDADTTDAVKKVQADAGLPVTGIVDTDTWDAIYDQSLTNSFSLTHSRVMPLAQLDAAREWDQTRSGNLKRRNPGWDPSIKVKSRTIAHGTMRKARAERWSERELRRQQGKNWVGTVSSATDLFAGDYHHGDPDPELLSRFELVDGMNLMVRGFDGDTLVHVAGADVGSDGGVRWPVDSQARDLPEIGAILARNAEAKRNRGREWKNENRSSRQTFDSVIPFSEYGGILDTPWSLAANQWNVRYVLGGTEGTIAKLKLQVDTAAYYCAVFGEEVKPGWLNAHVGNPALADADGNPRWMAEDLQDRLFEQRTLLYAAGTAKQPCGYGNKLHTAINDAGEEYITDAPVTGKYVFDAGFPYRCYGQPLLWVAIWPLEAATMKPCRVMWPQQTEGM